MRLSRDAVLGAVRQHPGLHGAALAELLGASVKAVECHLLRLADRGLLENRGTRRGGSSAWKTPARAAWYERAAQPARRVASVFDLG